MADLQERLHALADRAAPAPTPAGLWRRGVRRHRVRRLEHLVVVALVVGLVGLIGVFANPLHPTPPAPARVPDSLLHVPDTLYVPDPFTAGTDRLGPPGQVAVLGIASRQTSWFHSQSAPFVVSAVDGSYRFLDLPSDATPDSGATYAVSPDGAYVAYPLRGRPRGNPFSDVVGVGIYDTMTGRVFRFLGGGQHGNSLDAIGFTADSRWAVAIVYDAAGQGTSINGRVVRWRLSDGQRVDGGSPTGQVLPTTPVVRLSSDVGSAAVSPGGRIVAEIASAGRFNGLYVAATSTGRDLPRRPVKGFHATRVLGWLDDRRVVVEGIAPPWATGELRVADARAHRYVGRLPVHTGQRLFPSPTYATDLLLRPMTSGKQPPGHWDPRPAAAILLFLLLSVMLAITGTRRAGA